MATAIWKPKIALRPEKLPRADGPTFRLTATKRRSLELLAEYFCLRVHDVAKLLRNRAPDANDLRTARRTLHILWKEGLLHRIPYLDLSTEAVCHVYGLTDRAAEEYGGKTFDDHAERTLDHELEITRFHIRLKILCEKHGWALYWQQADLKTATVHPDAYFAVTDPAKPEGRNTHHFFLEVERSKISNYKEGQPSIVRKLAKYYALFGKSQCEKDWGMQQFRVIVVQRTDARRRNLCNALHAKYPHLMFWLTTEALCGADFTGEIFITPKNCEAQRYGFSGIFGLSSSATEDKENARAGNEFPARAIHKTDAVNSTCGG
jgi:Fe2+ or Zn2+ uptake regulation protein